MDSADTADTAVATVHPILPALGSVTDLETATVTGLGTAIEVEQQGIATEPETEVGETETETEIAVVAMTIASVCVWSATKQDPEISFSSECVRLARACAWLVRESPRTTAKHGAHGSERLCMFLQRQLI